LRKKNFQGRETIQGWIYMGIQVNMNVGGGHGPVVVAATVAVAVAVLVAVFMVVEVFVVVALLCMWFQDSERVVSQEDGIALAKELGYSFFKCSVKTRENVEQYFETLALKAILMPFNTP
jgi:hypothetical protein